MSRKQLLITKFIMIYITFVFNFLAFASSSDSLIAYYSFDDTLIDESNSVTRYDGNCTETEKSSCPNYVISLFNNAANFDGTKDFINTSIKREQFNNISICLWFKYLGDHEKESYKALIGGSSGNFFIGKNDKTSGIGVHDSEFKIISSTSDAWNGEWHFLCFVSYESYENNKIIKKNKLFIDATQIGSTTNFSGGTGDIYIAHENESDGYYFKGLIDEVKIYNKELNETEIKTLFDSSAINCDPDCYEAGKKSVKRGDYNDNEKIDLGDAIGILQELTTSSTKYQLTSCKAILDNGISKGDGIYTIDPDGQGNIEPFDVFCDMSSDGGGWTKIEYKMDLELKNHFNDEGDKSRYLSNNFETVLSTDKILAIQKVSTEGKQQYVGECKNVIHYLYEAAETDKYRHAFGYKFIDNTESFSQRQDYTDPNNPNLIIQVLEDGCKENDDVLRSTSVMIKSVKVPLINVKSSDNGDSTDKFGSQLTKNPAWLR